MINDVIKSGNKIVILTLRFFIYFRILIREKKFQAESVSLSQWTSKFNIVSASTYQDSTSYLWRGISFIVFQIILF